MSEHKTGRIQPDTEDRKLYRERRRKGLRGQIAAINVHRVVKDENGDE